ncbi:AAA family ATPase [Lysobacter sp. CA196]|uniref:AAA family ATPase n=1 Tax=Lysobacter sp. CA196 TaxID=3455606 RepID=UPI003F8CF8F3
MRKVKRLATPPSLRRPELLDWAREITAFYSRPVEERQRQRAPFERYEPLFLGEDVFAALDAQFKSKCAYCESGLQLHESRIDPFRPILAAADPRTREESPDHYGWLAFEWRNLMYACEECVSAKRNQFPVDTPRALPMTAWRQTVASESALLIDPCRDDPARHLAFLPDGRLAGKTDKGEASIEVVNLNRPRLVEARRRWIFDLLTTIHQAIDPEAESITIGLIDELDNLWHSGAIRSALDTVAKETARRAGLKPIVGFRPSRDIPRLTGHHEVWDRVGSEYLAGTLNASAWFASETSSASLREYRELKPRFDTARVERVRIFNFKAIENVELEFAGAHASDGVSGVMLLGENAAGKSTVLQALALALMDDRLRTGSKAEGNDFLPRGRESWDVLTDRPYVEVLMSTGDSRRVEIDSLGRVEAYSHSMPSMVLAYGARRFFKAHADIPRNAFNRSLFDPLAMLEDPSPWLIDATDQDFNAVARAMREIFALHDDDDIFRIAGGHVMVRAHGRVTPIERMSDGYRSLFAMAVDIMRRMVEAWGNLEYAQGIVLIDEIDVHLHPRWKIEVMSALRRAMPKVQFIVTAHDALCLRGMRDGEVHVLYRDRYDRIRPREDLPNIELLRSDQLLTSDLFGLASTARPQTDAALNRYAYLLGKPELAAGERHERDALAGQLAGLPLGDTPVEQLVGEATQRYLSDRRRRAGSDRAAMREDALEEIVAMLATNAAIGDDE